MIERQALVALYSHVFFGPARSKLLIDYFGSAVKVWNASKRKLLEVGLKPERVEEFIAHREKFDEAGYFKLLKKLKIDFITINDSNYPENLADLSNAPPVLYIKGKIKTRDSSAVAVVGTRKMTSYGREVTEQFV